VCWSPLSEPSYVADTRLTQGTPAHNALHCQVGLASGRSLGGDWRCRPGRAVSLRSWSRWTDQLRNDTALHLFLPTSGDRPLVEQRDGPRAGYAMTTTTSRCRYEAESDCYVLSSSPAVIVQWSDSPKHDRAAAERAFPVAATPVHGTVSRRLSHHRHTAVYDG